MIVTQKDIIREIAEKEDINIATVRDVFDSAEKIIFDYLSSTDPTTKMILKPLTGFNIERRYVGERNYTKGMFQDLNCPERTSIKSNVSKYYNDKVNRELFNKD